MRIGNDLLGADVADDSAHDDSRQSFLRFALLRNPARLCSTCLAARDRQRLRRDVLGDRRSGGDVGVLADAHRRDQLAVAADERAVLDDRLMLVHAVVVAGDRAGADVDLLADRRVAEIRRGDWPSTRARALVFFSSTKLPTCASSPTSRLGPEVRERADSGAALAMRDSRITQKLLTTTSIAERRVDDADARLDLAAARRCVVRPSR